MELHDAPANSRSIPKTAQDARGAVRYQLRASVAFEWLDDRGRRHTTRGHTRDISVRGAYIIATGCPPRGMNVSLNVYLPTLPDEQRFIQVKAEGRVVRIGPADRAGVETGFAIHNKRVLICDK